MNETNAPGKSFLKVASIIGIVFAVLALLINLVGAATVENFSDTVALDVTAPMGLSWGVWYTISFLSVGFGLFAYIMGVINCENLNKAGFLQILGAILIISAIAFGIMGFDEFGVLMIVMLAMELILPVLYTVGASKNKKALQS